jgi:hypothetical protein
MALAVCRLGMPIGTAKFRLVVGLCQISWLPLPCRTSVQPAAQQITQRPVKLRRHSDRDRLGFAQGGDLQEQGFRIDAGMIVRQEIERHRGNLCQ